MKTREGRRYSIGMFIIVILLMGFGAWAEPKTQFIPCPVEGAIEVRHPYSNEWYKVYEVPEGITWLASVRKCEALKGHLVSISTPTEKEFLKKLVDLSKTWIYKDNTVAKPTMAGYTLTKWQKKCGGRKPEKRNFYVCKWEIDAFTAQGAPFMIFGHLGVPFSYEEPDGTGIESSKKMYEWEKARRAKQKADEKRSKRKGWLKKKKDVLTWDTKLGETSTPKRK